MTDILKKTTFSVAADEVKVGDIVIFGNRVDPCGLGTLGVVLRVVRGPAKIQIVTSDQTLVVNPTSRVWIRS